MTRVAEVMTRRFTAVAPDTLVRQAEALMEERGIHHLLVIRGRELAGVLCTCDLRGRLAAQPVSQCMSTPARTIGLDASILDAAELMRMAAVGCLPVVARGEPVGIVTRIDLRRAGVPLERMATRFCAACHTDHDLAPARPGEVPFCFDCIERSHPLEDEELGCTD